MGKRILLIVAIVFLIAITAFFAWVYSVAPCSVFQFSASQDVPARCLEKFVK